jgi:molybdopterin/thiamine biosynthesis adenylyltransferase
MGGVGGIHLVTLARLGIGRFTIADPDVFETVNFNRQYGATTRTLGRSKAKVMAEEARAINPEVDLRVFSEAITAENVDAFLDGADVLLDGLDFLNIEARRLVFRRAAERGIWAITAGPIGFSTAWLVFDPDGMSFDRYFDLDDGMDRIEQLIAFAVGLTPRATHLVYTDLGNVDLHRKTAPSAGLACQLSAGVAAAEILKVLLDRSSIRPAPCYAQFDARRGLVRRGRLWRGNCGLLQLLKRALLRYRVRQLMTVEGGD